MGRGEYKRDVISEESVYMRMWIIAIALLIVGSAAAYADIPADRGGEGISLLIVAIVIMAVSVVLWAVIRSRKK